MALFDNWFGLPGHDATLRQLDEIIEEYQKACYATGKRVDQPHLKESARKAIQALSHSIRKVTPTGCLSERSANLGLGSHKNGQLLTVPAGSRENVNAGY
jgi:hypothetical protein